MTLETYRNRIISAAWLLRRAKTASAEAKARRELDAAVDALEAALAAGERKEEHHGS